MEKGDKDIKAQLDQLIDWFARSLPDPARVKADLLKFAKMHDRRSYQLIRFCFSPESDYRTVYKAIVSRVRKCDICCTDNSQKELSKRIESASGAPAGLLETLTPLL